MRLTFAFYAKIDLVKEAQFVSILAHPRLDFCSEVVSSQDKQLCIAFSLKGQDATAFCKDLTAEFLVWQIENPEELHQKVLDLLSFVREHKLELEFSLSLLKEEGIIFTTYSGEVILKRNGQARKILASNKEIKIIAGNFKENDQIILINQSSNLISNFIMEMLEKGISIEKLISDSTLLQGENSNLETSLAFLTYKEQASEIAKDKFNFKKVILRIWQLKFVLKKIPIFLKKILEILKKIISILKKQDKKKMLIGLIAICVAALIIFISVTTINRQNQKITNNIAQQITEIGQSTNNIEQLLLEQPISARENAQKSLQAVENLKQEKNNKDSLKLIDAEINRLQQLIDRISGENSLDQLSIAYNLDNFLATKIEFKNKEIFALESNGKEILRIKEDQTQEKISLENQATIRDFTVSDDNLFVLSKGIQILDLKNPSAGFREIKAEGESDGGGEFLTSFGPYLYLLNKDKRNVYRYYYKDEELSEPIGWLVDKQGINFDSVSNLIVDGDLWMAFKNGNLLKFTKGSTADFSIKGLDNLPNSSVMLSANDAMNALAILEKQNKRLLILTKDGQLISEIKSNELAGVSSIAFNEDGAKIYVLSGSVIYEVEI